MRSLMPTTAALAEILLAAATATLPAVPTASTMMVVPASWSGGQAAGVVSQFDLDVWADATISLTGAELLAARLHGKAISATAATSTTHASNIFTKAAHGLLTGDGPVQLTTSGTLPAGLSLLVDYWIVKVDANTFSLATSLANAMAGTVIDFTSDGTGTHTYTGASAKRVYWHSYGSLPTISLAAQKAWTRRCCHRPENIAYGVSGTLDTGSVFTAITPVTEK